MTESIPDAGSRRPESSSLADSVERVAGSTVGLATRRRGVNAGVVWQAGVVVTCASAIGRAPRVAVIGADGEARDGEVRGLDASTDLAVIAVATEGLVVASRRDGPALRVGDAVFATGRDDAGLVHASFGRIGAANGSWRTWRGGAIERLIRLDGGLYPGLGGAPIADDAGQVVGVASAALSRHHGVVLPAETIDRVARRLLEHGSIRRGYLGVVVQAVALSEGLAAEAGVAKGKLPQQALLVAGIGADGPAARAGLQVGDIIVTIGGQPVSDLASLRTVLDGAEIDAPLPLRLLRGGVATELEVTVAAREERRRC